MSTTDLWTYRDGTPIASMDLSGFKVEAVDGSIGSIDEVSNEVGASYLVVDTGPWIFGKESDAPGRRGRSRRQRRGDRLRQQDEGRDQGRARVRRVALSRRAVSGGTWRLLRP
jgi:hypothetical protein